MQGFAVHFCKLPLFFDERTCFSDVPVKQRPVCRKMRWIVFLHFALFRLILPFFKSEIVNLKSKIIKWHTM